MEEKEERRIEVVYLRPSEIGTGFGNPRKAATSKKAAELCESLNKFGDFGVLVVDENNDIISGNQRLNEFLASGDDSPRLCKKLIGYSVAEKRAINIKSNLHAGEWDVDILADWTADLNIDVGLKIEEQSDPYNHDIDAMELVHYEKYDYVLIACRDELSYNSLVRTLGIEDKHVLLGPKKRKIKGRAIWFEDMKVNFVTKDE